MSSKTYTRVLDHSQAKGSARFVLTIIADYADDLGYAFPGQETLSEKTRLTRRHMVNLIKSLEADRELFVYRKRGRGNRYLIRVGLDRDDIVTAVIRHFNMSLNDADYIYRFNQTPQSSEMISPPSSEMISLGSEINSLPSSEMISLGSEMEFTRSLNNNNSDLDALWASVKKDLKGSMSLATFNQWIAPTQLINLNGQTATITATNPNAVEWINDRLVDLISMVLSEQLERDVLVTAVSKQ